MEREELERWREAGIEVGRKLGVVQERERIIKLFVDSFEWNDDLTISQDEIVALIKRENK